MMSTMIILLLSSLFSFMDFSSTYPVDISEYTDYRGGRVVIASDNLQNITSYYLKPNWGAEENVMYAWDGIDKSDANGISLENSFVLDVMPLDDRLFVLVNDNLELKCIIYDKHLNRKANIILPVYIDDVTKLTGEIIGRLADDVVVIKIDNYLIYIKDLKGYLDFKLIDDKVDYAHIITTNDGQKNVLAMRKEKQFGSISQYNEKGYFVKSSRIQVDKQYEILESENYYAVVINSGKSGYSFLQMVEKSTGNLVFVKWLEAQFKTILLTQNDQIVYIKKQDEKRFISFNKILSAGIENVGEENIPDFLFTPIALEQNKGELFAIFKQGFAVYDFDGNMNGTVSFSVEPKFSDNIAIYTLPGYYIFSSSYYSIILSKQNNDMWWFNRIMYEIWIYLIPIILLILLFIVFRLKNHSQRLLNQILNLDSSGVVYMVDAKGFMSIANEAGKKLIGVTDLTLRKKHFSYYLKKEMTMPIYRLLIRSLESRSSISEKTSFKFDAGEKEWLCTAATLRNVAGAFRGVVFSGIDITEQLEKKRLTNWAQLAHDMQTNLSTIRLNTENIEVGSEIVMKSKHAILHQTNLLIRRVRDIVTVGRQEEVHLDKQNTDDICSEARLEFDDSMFPGVKFDMKVEVFQLYCDKARMVRAVRNAIENGVKAMPDQKGNITVSCKRVGSDAVFSIKDTGKGMDDKTKKKMLQPYFTTAKNSGGHGIGTMIIQRVVEQHGGEMFVNSEVGKGTEIVLKVPNYKRKISN